VGMSAIGLGQWPDKNIPAGYTNVSQLTEPQKRDVAALVPLFPAIFKQAQADYAKFKTGVAAGLFDYSQKQTIGDWFKEFPQLWAAIRPNWESMPGGTVSTHQYAFMDSVDAWLKKVTGDHALGGSSLGVIPFIVIAGVLIAAALGIGGAVWAVGYVKKQNNITSLIEGVVSGKIPSSVLNNAIDQEQSTGLFGDLKGILIAGAVIFGLFTFGPALKGLLPSKGKT
jgi:hypothetical protein